jgi:hypothetical protein
MQLLFIIRLVSLRLSLIKPPVPDETFCRLSQGSENISSFLKLVSYAVMKYFLCGNQLTSMFFTVRLFGTNLGRLCVVFLLCFLVSWEKTVIFIWVPRKPAVSSTLSSRWALHEQCNWKNTIKETSCLPQKKYIKMYALHMISYFNTPWLHCLSENFAVYRLMFLICISSFLNLYLWPDIMYVYFMWCLSSHQTKLGVAIGHSRVLQNHQS